MNRKHFSKPSYQHRLISSQIEKMWLAFAKQRLDDINRTRVETISSIDVFQRINQRLKSQRLN